MINCKMRMRRKVTLRQILHLFSILGLACEQEAPKEETV